MEAERGAMGNEFQSLGFVRDRMICYRHDLQREAKLWLKSLLGRPPAKHQAKSRYTSRAAKELVLSAKLAVAGGKPSWFYTAFERNDLDPLTNYALGYIESSLPKQSKILVTGCGTGITVFLLADLGFQDLMGIDLLPNCIDVANRIKTKYAYNQTAFAVQDCFQPRLVGQFDLITAMHWVFSAWMGNYGNEAVCDPFDPKVRESLLDKFLSAYAPHLNPDGVLILELTDAVADYRLATDHAWGDASTKVYPVRHTPEQVAHCAGKFDLEILDRKLSVSYGHQPRTSYFLKKLRR